jgi:EAL domain-containing protein (putative c-di-GMP-specific phosphodiesterase class I)
MALYHAKAAGKNCCAEFEPFMRMRVEAQHRLLSDVRSGLLQGQFTLHYLPQFELKSRRLTGFEALLRWVHPQEGLLKPGRFAEALTDAVLSRELSNFALERAVEQIADWRNAGWGVGFVAVNVAQSQIGQKGFADHVRDLLGKHGVEAHLLMVEVVEQSVLEDASSVAVAELQELRDAGVTISLDDFGTGYASLTHLRKFPIRQLKIDRTVTDSIDKDITSLSVTKSIIELARTLNMRTVAEGVERQAVADILAACGCDQAQGFLWSGPLSAHEASKLFFADGRFERHGGAVFSANA